MGSHVQPVVVVQPICVHKDCVEAVLARVTELVKTEIIGTQIPSESKSTRNDVVHVASLLVDQVGFRSIVVVKGVQVEGRPVQVDPPLVVGGGLIVEDDRGRVIYVYQDRGVLGWRAHTDLHCVDEVHV